MKNTPSDLRDRNISPGLAGTSIRSTPVDPVPSPPTPLFVVPTAGKWIGTLLRVRQTRPSISEVLVENHFGQPAVFATHDLRPPTETELRDYSESFFGLMKK